MTAGNVEFSMSTGGVLVKFLNELLKFTTTGPIMEFDKIHLKEAIVMWPDMHSFLEFDKFEPISNFKFLFEKLITCFVLAI